MEDNQQPETTTETTTVATPTYGHNEAPTYEEELIHQLARELKAHAKEQGKSAYSIATTTGLSVSTISKLFAGKSNPRLSTLIKVTDALDLKLVVRFVPETTA